MNHIPDTTKKVPAVGLMPVAEAVHGSLRWHIPHSTHTVERRFITGQHMLYAKNTIDAEVTKMREQCAMKLQVTRADVSLAAGEMTAQEWRTCYAVLRWMQARIRSDSL